MNNLVRTLLYDGQVSLTVADTTELVREGARLHKLSATSTKTFGRALSAMTFMSACLKADNGEISLSLKSDGLCQEIAVSGNKALRLRGYIVGTNVTGEDENAEKVCFGNNGSITIIRDDGYNRPFVGSCAFPEQGNIDEAFEEYYRISEQLPTRFFTVVELQNGECIFAGVAVLQLLPFADAKVVETVENTDLKPLLEQVKTKGVFDAVKETYTVDERVYEERAVVYQCNCSKEYIGGVLVSVGERQMRQIIQEDGAVRVHCHYCNTDYEFDETDVDKMFSKS